MRHGRTDEPFDQLVANRVQGTVLTGRRDDRSPAAGGASLSKGDLSQPAIQLTGVVAGADDMKREILEHPDANAIASWR